LGQNTSPNHASKKQIEQQLGNDGTQASRPCKPDDGDNQMKE
jgi:hypothetical protein